MSKFSLPTIVAFALIAAAASTAHAGVIALPSISVKVPGQSTPIVTSISYSSGGVSFQNTFSSAAYNWSFSGSIDPLLNWSFSTTVPGPYTVTLNMPVIGGPYNTLKNQGIAGLSDGGGPAGSSIGSIVADGQINGNSVPAVQLTGNLPVGASGLGSLNLGPLTTTQSFGTPSLMTEVLNFTLTSADNDASSSFSGQLNLTEVVPEPASLSLLAIGAAGLLCRKSRR